jgi:hypothetical protein
MARASKNEKDIVKEAMHDFKEGTLKSSDGSKVTNSSQAIAIALNEAREASARKTGHRGGSGTAHNGGSRSASTGAGRSGSTSQRNTNR